MLKKLIDYLVQDLRKKRGNLRSQKRAEENEQKKEILSAKKENLDIAEDIATQIGVLEKYIIDNSSEIREQYLLKIN